SISKGRRQNGVASSAPRSCEGSAAIRRHEGRRAAPVLCGDDAQPEVSAHDVGANYRQYAGAKSVRVLERRTLFIVGEAPPAGLLLPPAAYTAATGWRGERRILLHGPQVLFRVCLSVQAADPVWIQRAHSRGAGLRQVAA